MTEGGREGLLTFLGKGDTERAGGGERREDGEEGGIVVYTAVCTRTLGLSLPQPNPTRRLGCGREREGSAREGRPALGAALLEAAAVALWLLAIAWARGSGRRGACPRTARPPACLRCCLAESVAGRAGG